MGGSIPLPMLVLVPHVLTSGSGMLGLGDIVLPGLLLSQLFRVDYALLNEQNHVKRRLNAWQVLAKSEGFFLPALLGYVVGLVLTFTALAVLQMGQPALLYLVPCTL